MNDKDQEQWVWLAMDADTREIVCCYVGDRSGKAAGALWDSLPAVYRQCAVFYTDFWSSYPVVKSVQTTSGSRQRHGKDKLH